MFLVRQKYVFFEKKSNFFDGKPKMTKKFEFKNLKIPPNGQISRLGILKFLNSNFFVIFGSHQKKVFFFKANVLLSYQKHFGSDSIYRKEDIL